MDPQARVKSFIADYLRLHTCVVTAKGDNLKLWSEAVRELDATHFTGGGGHRLGSVFYGLSPHEPNAESIVGESVRDGHVYVETRMKHGVREMWWEYELTEHAGDWRILCMREYLHDANVSLITAQDHGRFIDPPLSPLTELSPEDVDCSRIFDAGREVSLDGRTSVIEVCPVGQLKLTTGIIVVGDFSYGPYSLAPLGQRVAPGQYGVDVAVAYGRNAALRVRFSDQRVAKWHPANMSGGGHVVGVDAGNVAVMDLSAIIGVKAREQERAFERYVECDKLPCSRMLSLSSNNDIVIADSGWGDGHYPLYWGVNVSGQLVVLLVDFLVIPDQLED